MPQIDVMDSTRIPARPEVIAQIVADPHRAVRPLSSAVAPSTPGTPGSV